MLSTMGSLLLVAVAMALSTVPITTTLIILLSPARKKSSVPFLVGWVGSLCLVILGAAGGVLALPVSRRERMTAIAVAEIVVGLALVALGIFAWRGSNHVSSRLKSWLNNVGSFGPVASFGVGLAMGFRPKALLLGAAAGFALASNQLSDTETAIAVGCYVVISASTVAFPIVWTLASPARIEPRLRAWQGWLDRNGPLLAGVTLIIIGVAIMGAGVLAL